MDILKFRRQNEAETRRRTAAVAAEWAALQALAQEHEDLVATLQLPAHYGAAVEPVAALRARYPEFHAQVERKARLGPLHQAQVAAHRP